MQKRVLLPLLCALIASLALTMSYHIPFNIPGLFVFATNAQWHPELQKTGEAVEYGFAWVIIRQPWVWALLTAYHMLFFAPASLLIAWARSQRPDDDD